VPKIFISHSSIDEKIGKQLVDAIIDMGIPVGDIFYSSDLSTGVPFGKEISSTIKMELEKADIIILILTKNFYKSDFCSSENGATWILGKECIPILLDDLDYKDMKGFFGNNYSVAKPNEDEMLKVFHTLKKYFELKITDNAAKKLFEEFIQTANNSITNSDDTQNTPIETSIEIRNNNIPEINEIENFILGDKITDEQALLFKYMIDRFVYILSVEFKIEEQLSDIKRWEISNSINYILSNNYLLSLRGLQIRNFIEHHMEIKGTGMPVEWRLKEPYKNQLFNLSKEATARLDEFKNKYKR